VPAAKMAGVYMKSHLFQPKGKRKRWGSTLADGTRGLAAFDYLTFAFHLSVVEISYNPSEQTA
jgi:hypothetical protein